MERSINESSTYINNLEKLINESSIYMTNLETEDKLNQQEIQKLKGELNEYKEKSADYTRSVRELQENIQKLRLENDQLAQQQWEYQINNKPIEEVITWDNDPTEDRDNDLTEDKSEQKAMQQVWKYAKAKLALRRKNAELTIDIQNSRNTTRDIVIAYNGQIEKLNKEILELKERIIKPQMVSSETQYEKRTKRKTLVSKIVNKVKKLKK